MDKMRTTASGTDAQLRRAALLLCYGLCMLLATACFGAMPLFGQGTSGARRTDTQQDTRQETAQDGAQVHHAPGTRAAISLLGSYTDEDGTSVSYPIHYREGHCPFLFDDDFAQAETEAITCGYMQVPQRRSDPTGLQIEIAVAIVDSVATAPTSSPGSSPIVYLEGGPGGGAVYDVEWWLDSPLRHAHPLILVDQRGTGFSWPNLGCPELYAEAWGEVDFSEGLALCRDRLLALGVDLSAYHSVENALDLRDLRRALGIEEWNLVGVSYGTRLALTALRETPAGVRSVVLDSVYPPSVASYLEYPRTFSGAIDGMLDGCAADADCREAFPELRESFYTLLLELEESPLQFTSRDLNYWGFEADDFVLASLGVRGEQGLEVDAYAFLWLLIEGLYDTDVIALLPRLIADTARGDYEMLLNEIWLLDMDELLRQAAEREFAERQRPDDAPPVDEISSVDADGMFYSTECYEEAAFATLESTAAQAASLDPLLLDLLLEDVAQFFEACEVWLGDAVAGAKPEPVYSAVPALILAGEYDPVTPPAWARRVAETLPNHQLVEMPRGGHVLLFSDPCFEEIILAFLANPQEAVDTACVGRAVRPFATR